MRTLSIIAAISIASLSFLCMTGQAEAGKRRKAVVEDVPMLFGEPLIPLDLQAAPTRGEKPAKKAAGKRAQASMLGEHITLKTAKLADRDKRVPDVTCDRTSLQGEIHYAPVLLVTSEKGTTHGRQISLSESARAARAATK